MDSNKTSKLISLHARVTSLAAEAAAVIGEDAAQGCGRSRSVNDYLREAGGYLSSLIISNVGRLETDLRNSQRALENVTATLESISERATGAAEDTNAAAGNAD